MLASGVWKSTGSAADLVTKFFRGSPKPVVLCCHDNCYKSSTILVAHSRDTAVLQTVETTA